MTPAERAQRRLQELASRLEPSLRRAFLDYARALSPESMAELVRLLEAGDVEAAVSYLTGSPRALAAATAVRASYAGGIIRTVGNIVRDIAADSPRRLVIASPVASPHLIAAVRRWEDGAFRRVANDVREGLRETIAAELQRGVNPRTVATQLKAGIATVGGTTAYDVRIVASFRKALEEGRIGDARRRALRDRRLKLSRDLTPAQIDEAVDAYRRKLTTYRAETFARTAAMQAANEASGIGWREAVAQGAVPQAELRRYWIVAADERLCPTCAPVPGLNDKGVGLDDLFTTPNGPVMHPPLHPNCVLGSTPITATPTIRAVTQRAFEGTVVVIETASGKRLACTENHPVLTPGGWVAAGLLDEGGDVVRYLNADRIPRIGDDHQHVPPSIEQIAESFGRSAGVRSSEVPVSPEHFHGDGAGSEVAVVWADGELGRGVDPALSKQSGKQTLAFADMGLPLLLSQRDTASLIETGDTPTGCAVCGSDLPASPFGAHAAPLDSLGLTLPTRFDAASTEAERNHVARDAHLSSDGVDGFSADVALDYAIHVKRESRRRTSISLATSSDPVSLEETNDRDSGDTALARELSSGCAGEVATDQIISIRRIEWSGHVFNLETEGGWYAADGIITHNCRCTTWTRRERAGVRQLAQPGTTRLVLQPTGT